MELEKKLLKYYQRIGCIRVLLVQITSRRKKKNRANSALEQVNEVHVYARVT